MFGTNTPKTQGNQSLMQEECSYKAVFPKGPLVIKSIRIFQIKCLKMCSSSRSFLLSQYIAFIGSWKPVSYSHLEIKLVALVSSGVEQSQYRDLKPSHEDEWTGRKPANLGIQE